VFPFSLAGGTRPIVSQFTGRELFFVNFDCSSVYRLVYRNSTITGY
jgi:hypothetical protein